MRTKLILLFIGLLLVSGCSSITGSRDFKQQLNIMEQHLLAQDWDKLNAQLDKLMSVYSKNEWKLQLLGDEGEYERLHESINRFITAVEVKGFDEARMELATLKTIVEDIYSL